MSRHDAGPDLVVRTGAQRPDRIPALPPGTAGARLLALSDDPVAEAGSQVERAQVAVADALGLGVDADLTEALEYAAGQLDAARRMIAEVRIQDLDLPAVRAKTLEIPGDPPVVLGAATLEVPALGDGIYGLTLSLRGILTYLTQAVSRLGGTPRRGAAARNCLGPLGSVAMGATYVERACGVIASQAWGFDRPGMPRLPGLGGEIELRASPRATPARRWARRSRLRFLPGRVDAVTASGRTSIGHDVAIAAMLHVPPPGVTALELRYDDAERYAEIGEFDELGTVHLLDAEGRSLGTFAIADWLAQPEVLVDQPQVDPTIPDAPLGVRRGVWALDAAGLAHAAATVGVPLRQGVAHPPAAASTVGLIRPGPQRQPYRGLGARADSALRRRRGRLRFWDTDLGPGTPAGTVLRGLGPYVVAATPFVLWPGGGRSWFAWVMVALTAAAVLDPWVAWIADAVADRVPRPRATATYRPRSAAPWGFRWRARLALVGGEVLVRGGGGHEAWIPGPGDPDLGVTRIVRLLDGGTAWGVALADRSGHWRLVLDAATWAPRGFAGLESFARDAGLELADQEAPPLPRLGQDVFTAGSRRSADRTTGPRLRGSMLLGSWALVPCLVTIWGPDRSFLLCVLVLGVTWGAALILMLVNRALDGRAPAR
ncbi:hypothetical protein Bcav_1619 [Beutenbergia cavernae DSM 12333]|uniref:Uncharacterized protein n=1 Tax=Beutenbergia cavernae (strain ATCC BAA-8 / DSM 12333 / CCUG 43141 / JCM 11478 / NBRC 16432 / NCIMB 13614 / HKI 0122) TaxID=471853 RepID=C5C3H6_BEUC1|nr:hypothetical protein [Beutenbergia cavernae]ACQ79875.1 hypothetical protein Bcav_1619 [Beutenbergia cavernae DSM 12333]